MPDISHSHRTTNVLEEALKAWEWPAPPSQVNTNPNYDADDNDANPDARALVVSKLWGQRRHSADDDSSSHLSDLALYQQSMRSPGLVNASLTFYFDSSTAIADNASDSSEDEELIIYPKSPSPLSPRSHHPPPTKTHQNHTATNTKTDPFLAWTDFDQATLPKRNAPTAMKRAGGGGREEVIEALAGVELVGVKGLGRLAKPIINRYHSSKSSRDVLREFQAAGERTILVPFQPEGGVGGGSPPGGRTRALERLESELFDTAKYLGNTNRLTVLTWTREGDWGSITLFEVDVTSGSSSMRGGGGGAVKIRPLAAMEDVPKEVLVSMRVDQAVRKVVLEHVGDEGMFRWKARVGQGPAYVRLRYSHRAVFGSGGQDGDGKSEEGRGSRAPEQLMLRAGEGGGSRRRPRPRSLLRVGDGTSSRRASSSGEADADGIMATIPQFLALMHTNRSILDVVASEGMRDGIETEDGDVVRAVSLKEKPEGKAHTGRDVHVVVLMPNRTAWAEEQILWTDGGERLVDLRHRMYWDAIDRGRIRSRRSAGMRKKRSGGGDGRSRSPPRTARW